MDDTPRNSRERVSRNGFKRREPKLVALAHPDEWRSLAWGPETCAKIAQVDPTHFRAAAAHPPWRFRASGQGKSVLSGSMSDELDHEPCCGLDAAMATLQGGIEQILRFGYYDATVILDLTDAILAAHATTRVQDLDMAPYDDLPATRRERLGA